MGSGGQSALPNAGAFGDMRSSAAQARRTSGGGQSALPNAYAFGGFG